jgi:2-iminobutanoate/2-iminopropanoate deaminase
MRTTLRALAITGAIALAVPAAAQPEAVSTERAPAAIGPYSQAILAGDTLYLAGQIAIDPQSGELAPGTIEEETRLVLQNLEAVLAAADMTMANVVSTTVFMADLEEFPRMNEVYATFFGDAPPARATVEVARLPRDVRVEIAAIAVR